MFDTLLKNRTYRLTALIFSLAVVMCGIAWLRFFTAAATNPSPVRLVEFVTINGARDPFQQECAGPSFIDGDSVWRFCGYGPGAARTASDTAPAWGMVRFDLDRGEASMQWPLPEPPDSQLLALAKSPAGDLAAVWGSPDMSGVYLILKEGLAIPLGLPSPAPEQVMGLAWAGERLELVATDGDPGGTAIFAYESGAWADPRPVQPPDGCDTCSLRATRLSDAAWQFVYVAAAPDAQEGVLWLGAESGSAHALGAIPLGDPVSFDHAPGGVVNWTLDAAPLVLDGETWTRVEAPSAGSSFYFSNYQITPDGLRWIPGLRYPQQGWWIDKWLVLQPSGDGVMLAEMGGDSGPTLTRSDLLLLGSGAQTSVLPASDGGYWVLGPYGAYLKVDRALERADHLNLFERFEREFENFGRFDSISGEFYRKQRALKLAAFPLVLLSLPAGYLLVFFVRQSRKNTRAWITLLLQVSAIYIVLATIFIWWFWELTGDF